MANLEEIKGIQRVQEYLDFCQFTALYSEMRQRVFGFKFNQGFADKYKIDINTLTQWKKREDFWERVKKIRDN